MKPSLKKVTINRIICKNNAFNNSRNIGFEYSLKMPQCYSELIPTISSLEMIQELWLFF